MSKRSKSSDNSAHAQRNRLLEALRRGPVSTIQARRDLDIMMPGTRVHELRHRHGHTIVKVMVWEDTEAGHPHYVAKYILITGSSDVENPPHTLKLSLESSANERELA